jgi:hypothetical protein
MIPFFVALLQLQCFSALVVWLVDSSLSKPEQSDSRFAWSIGTCAAFQLLQLLVSAGTLHTLALTLTFGIIRPVYLLHVAANIIFHFAGLYSLFFLITPESFQASAFLMEHDSVFRDFFNRPVLSLCIHFVYFSSIVFTTTGLGDIAPAVWWSRIFVSVQMVCSLALFVNHLMPCPAHH